MILVYAGAVTPRNVLGEAVAGPLEGLRLEPLVHHDIFWFVWSAFQPGGDLYEKP